MHRSPLVLRLTLALFMALGLLGAFALPTLAQDASPTVEPEPTVETTPEPTVEPIDEEVNEEDEVTGSLLLLYYLCDGNVGFIFTVGNPGEGNPNTLVDDCGIATAATDTTFLIYPFGDLEAEPTEITTVDGVIMVDLPITNGTPHTISQKIPDLTPEEIEAEVEPVEPITADFEVVEATITGVNATQYQVGLVEIYKFRCEGDPTESSFNILNPNDPFDPSPYDDCSADDRAFTITPFDKAEEFDPIAVSTVDGLASLEDVPTTSIDSGRHHIVEDGTEIEGDFDVEAGQTTIIVAVNYAAPSGSLVVTKLECVGTSDTEFYVDEDAPQASDPNEDCTSVEGVTFSVYPFGNQSETAITLTTDADGIAEEDFLPITEDADAHLLVEDSTGAEVNFDITVDTVTTINVVNFVAPPAEDGTLEIEKLDCAGIANTSLDSGNPGDNAFGIPSYCNSGFASFVIYPFGDDSGNGIEVDVDGYETIELPPTEGSPHLLVEVDNNFNTLASTSFEIESNTTTPAQALNPTFGSVQIYSYLCKGNQTAYFQVYAPGSSATLPSSCSAINRLFYITVFGDDPNGSGDTVSVSTVSETSVIFSGVPATGDYSHTIQPSSGAATGSFDVNQGQITAIIYYTFQSTDSGTDDDDTDDSESVTDLADTGMGMQAGQTSNLSLLFALLSVGSLIAVSDRIRRRSHR